MQGCWFEVNKTWKIVIEILWSSNFLSLKIISMLYSYLKEIPDFRRNQSKKYLLADVLIVVIIWIIWWSTSYRELESYIKNYLKPLKKLLWLKRKKEPDYSTIRNIIIWCDTNELEKAFRLYSSRLLEKWENNDYDSVWIDWKTMRWSFDKASEQKAFHILNVFCNTSKIVLWHKVVETEKTNEIPMAQEVINEIWLTWAVYTLDALHCQKKH